MIGIAFTLLTPIFIGLTLGFVYDRHTSSKFPAGILIGGFLGMFTGIYSLYKSYK